MDDKLRARNLNSNPDRKGPVVYWMSRDQRARDNHALTYAQNRAIRYKAPLKVIFCLAPEYLGAPVRHYDFMLKGLKETEKDLKENNIPLEIIRGEPKDTIPEYIKQNHINTMVTDFSPLRIKRQWTTEIAGKIRIPFHEVDAHNIVPAWEASGKKEYGAYTLRPKIDRKLNRFLKEPKEPEYHPYNRNDKDDNTPPDWKEIENTIKENPNIDKKVRPITWLKPGRKQAEKNQKDFIENMLDDYAEKRNDPTKKSTSNLSPYIHFGQISAQRIALEIMRSDASTASKESFLDELIVRRELSDNYCFYEKDYDNIKGIPEWSRKTLKAHEKDRREYIYTEEEFEKAETHDDLWNAAQKEMTHKGKMHSYMRMYWAKKILEWTRTPEEAIRIAIHLNDRYELDGRDPNGYAGIMWSIGGLQDRAWGERQVFGKIRYMSGKAIKRKFNTAQYITANRDPDLQKDI